MKKGFLNTLKGILGIVILCGFGVGLVYWETYGREALIYEDVLTLTKSVQKNTVIEEDMITVIKTESAKMIEGAIVDPKQIIGLETKNYIPAKAQLCSAYFDKANMVMGPNEFIFKIPNDWLATYPTSLRRKDNAVIQAIGSKSAENNEFIGGLVEGKLFKTTIAYVKDSANKEVTDMVDTEVERKDATSNPSSVEIIINQTQLDTMKNYIARGYTFAIVYQ